MAESAVVFSIVFMLTLGTFAIGLGIVQYQELSWLAQEGARWAAVHGSTYQAEQSASAPTSQSVMTNVITPKAGLLTPGNVNCTLTMTNGTATVSLSYVWSSQAYLSPVTLRSSSSIPITY
jgi:Flp pilus assembly protein TadG